MNAKTLASIALDFRFAIRSHTGIPYATVGDHCLNAAFSAEQCAYIALSYRESGRDDREDTWCTRGMAYLADALVYYRASMAVSLIAGETQAGDWPYFPVYGVVDNNSGTAYSPSPPLAPLQNQTVASATEGSPMP